MALGAVPPLGLVLIISAFAVTGVWSQSSWPWQVSIQRDGAHVCGGTLLSPTWVVSSASCLQSASVLSGWLAVLNRTETPMQFGIKKVIVHEAYTMQISGYDIALARLNKTVNNTAAIGFPKTTDSFNDGTECTVTGWGNVHKAAQVVSPFALQVANVSLMNYSSCNEMFQGRYVPNILFIQSDMMCSFSKIGPGACQGDTGGPLVCGSRTLAGILSWNMGCGADSIGVYTRVASFVKWISETQLNNLS